MGAVLPPTSCLCEQRAQGWAPPTGSLLTGLPTGGGSPSLEPPALGPTFRRSSCGSEVECLTKASADLVTAAGKCSGAAFTMIPLNTSEPETNDHSILQEGSLW